VTPKPSRRKAAALIGLLLAIAGCAAPPPRRIYELGRAADPKATAAVAAGPVLRLAPVLVPDYLDSNDIVLRVGEHQLQPAATARWGERLSWGVTHALASDLAERMPAVRVSVDPSGEESAARLLVSVETFDVWADGHCVLKANWSILGMHGDVLPGAGGGTFVATPGAGNDGGDTAVVDAMAAAVEKLADGLAPAAAAAVSGTTAAAQVR